MKEKTMPVLFVGHGSPMLALDSGEAAQTLQKVGSEIRRLFKTPKAILAISAHWYGPGSFVNESPEPEQIYDMYGFPQELYDYKYPAKGLPALAKEVETITGSRVQTTTQWGIDHGVWTVLAHMFPDADIPVVAMSVDGSISTEKMYEIGKALSPLRKQGVLIMASGNIVHNLRQIDWNHPGATAQAIEFDEAVVRNVIERNDEAIIHYQDFPSATYGAPTPDHFLPLIYALGASQGEKPVIFNRFGQLGAVTMTGFIFGLPDE